ncbi:Glutamine-dependent NAD(+) synthetase [Clonorchis sinensis]|uniref:Glutamine-dependent NAD(+) synthetase n=1 Tax=Clonorchis sinensis TaxID=79923 RepID=A0A8T1MCD9_CLOSI|nr:Glutamine-dependent NAD(+) synthetase [Clonorchis sinensis]
MPVILSGVAYNCRVVILNGRILLIRPKLVLADGGLHRETRWFTAWPHPLRVIEFSLPSVVRKVARDAQATTTFGDALLHFVSESTDGNILIGLEICEELWIGSPPHLKMYASGVDVVLNASASHHELRKLDQRINLVQMASRSSGGGLYAYTNLRGCDSERICYDGGAMAAVSGKLVLLGKQFGLDEVEVNTVTVDLNAIRSRRIGNTSFGRNSAALAALDTCYHSKTGYPVIKVDFSACHKVHWAKQNISDKTIESAIVEPLLLTPEEEIARGPALWLWDILRRSKSAGFFLCLSGGLDSASVACLVLSLCNEVYKAIRDGNVDVLRSCCRIIRESEANVLTLTPRDICSRLFYTCYMPSENSSTETAERASRLADAIGSHHLTGNISDVVSSLLSSSMQCLQMTHPPRYETQNGCRTESLALQNVQARSRLVLAYLVSQLLPSLRNLTGGLLVLSSANLDESLRGYATKYDCSSADLNPIGGISKADLRRFVHYCKQSLSECLDPEHCVIFQQVVQDIISARPTAELMPLSEDGGIQQMDEEEMGLTYDMLSLFGRLRKIDKCGPYSMLRCLLDGAWCTIKKDVPSDCFTQEGRVGLGLARFLADKVKLFFHAYGLNRHKATVLPPAYHAEAYGADDNRFDLRPHLYPVDWTHQFSCIERLVSEWEAQLASQGASSCKKFWLVNTLSGGFGGLSFEPVLVPSLRMSVVRIRDSSVDDVFPMWLKWLEREFTDRKVRGSNPTSASRLPLSRLGQPGSISAFVLPSGGMAARHRKSATAEHLNFCLRVFTQREFTDRKVRGSNPTSASRLPLSRLGQPGSIPVFVIPSGGMAARHRNGATAQPCIWIVLLHKGEFTDRNVRDSKPTSASRLHLSRLGRSGSIPALWLSSGGMAARHPKGVTAEQFLLSWYMGLRKTSAPTEQSFFILSFSGRARSCSVSNHAQGGSHGSYPGRRVPPIVPILFVGPFIASANLRVGNLSACTTLNWARKTALSSTNADSESVIHEQTNKHSAAGRPSIKVPVTQPNSRFPILSSRICWHQATRAGEMAQWLECEFTDRKVGGSNPTSASRLDLSKLGRSGSIPALWLSSGGMAVTHGPQTFRSVVRNPPLPLDFPCLGLGNLAVSQPSCFLRMAWQLGTERVLQLNDFFKMRLPDYFQNLGFSWAHTLQKERGQPSEKDNLVGIFGERSDVGPIEYWKSMRVEREKVRRIIRRMTNAF